MEQLSNTSRRGPRPRLLAASTTALAHHQPAAGRIPLRTTLTILLVTMAGCSHQVFSPPAGTLPLTTSSSVGTGRTAVRAEMGLMENVNFGPEAGSGALGVRFGLSDRVEFDAQATAVRVLEDVPDGTDPNIYAGRLGAKYTVGESSALAFTGGLGSGQTAGGSFVSADIGLIAAHETTRWVPFVAARGFVSEPINPEFVHTSSSDPSATDAPMTTYGAMGRLGVKLHLESDWRERRRRSTLGASVGLTAAADGSDEIYYADVALGFELAL